MSEPFFNAVSFLLSLKSLELTVVSETPVTRWNSADNVKSCEISIMQTKIGIFTAFVNGFLTAFPILSKKIGICYGY